MKTPKASNPRPSKAVAPTGNIAAPAPQPGRIRRAFRAIFPPTKKWREALPAFGLAIVSALLVRVCHRPLYWSPVAFVALVPLFWGVSRLKPMMAFWVGLLFASILGVFGTGWFVVVDRFNGLVWAGIVPLAVYIGFYFAAALALIVFFARRMTPWAGLGTAMLVWAGIEWWFGIGALGMPYGLAQTQGGWLAMAHVAALGGMPLLSALIVGVNLAVMETILSFRAGFGQAGALMRLGAMGALAAAGCLYGTAENHATGERYHGENSFSLNVALLQTNIDQATKYESYKSTDETEKKRLQDEMNAATFTQLRSLDRGDAALIVLPESPFTTEFMDIDAVIQHRLYGRALMTEIEEFARDIQTPVIIGGVDNTFRDPAGGYSESALNADGTYRDPGRIYSGLWLIRPADLDIRMTADYRKVQLMPFGETVPYLGLIPGFAEKVVQIFSFDRGRLTAPIGFLAETEDGTMKEVRLGPSICFEDQFPYIQRHFAAMGANLFVNTTNDGWFDGSPGPAWHAEMARWRSIETGIPMVRCTNSGVTCIFGPTGEYVEKLPPMEQGILRAPVRLLENPPKTLFTRIGFLFGPACFFGLLTLIGFSMWRARKIAAQNG